MVWGGGPSVFAFGPIIVASHHNRDEGADAVATRHARRPRHT
ncbi:MAG: hypothetical protein ABL973_09000 [Micropepsaceae bacterium]